MSETVNTTHYEAGPDTVTHEIGRLDWSKFSLDGYVNEVKGRDGRNFGGDWLLQTGPLSHPFKTPFRGRGRLEVVVALDDISGNTAIVRVRGKSGPTPFDVEQQYLSALIGFDVLDLSDFDRSMQFLAERLPEVFTNWAESRK